MNRRVVLLAPLVLAAARAAKAQIFTSGGITIDHPWAKPSVTEAAAAFLVIENRGRRADRLVGGASPIAERVILREFDGSPLEFYDLEPGRRVTLQPGRRYIALRGLKRILAVDDVFPLTLAFAEAPPLEISVVVAEGPDDS
ncbi:MAG TPA: copper chaperone PCu(A)C [Stellaceae bacterium]|nr:copper chaperone PCu(A)C [Stellaceae bacterium]